MFRVQVAPNARSFKAKLQEQVTKTPIPIPVRPDTRGFRAKMIEQLKNLTVPVEVIPTAPAKVSAAARAAALATVPTGPTGAGGAAGGIQQLSKEEQRLQAIQAGLLEGQLALDSAFEEGLTAEQQKARLQEAVNLATKNATTASHELAAAYAAEAAEAIKTLEPLRERAVLQRLEAEAAATRGAAGASQAAEAEAAIAAEEKAHRAALTGLTTAEIRFAKATEGTLSPLKASQELHKALGAAESAETTLIRQEAAAILALNEPLVASLQPLKERAALLISNTEQEIANLEAVETRAAAVTAGAEAEKRARAALATNVSLITKSSELTALNTELKGAAAEVADAHALAVEAENTALIQQLAAIDKDIVAMQGLIVSQRESIASTQLMTEKMALARRGFIATALSALGARGATLAASSEFLIAAAAATALFKSVQSAAQFETQLAVFGATAGATAAQLEEVSARAKQLGNDITLPGVSAGEAAQAMTELAKAGLTVQDAIAGSRGVLQLATAADIDNAQATELVASALNAFGLAGTQAIRVADLLTGSAIESQGSITDMGIALQQSAAAARQAGFSVEDTVALLTLLARNGLKGSDAGTSLRTALIRLINPTNKAQDALNGLNIQIRDAQGNVRPEVFADMGVALSQLSAKQRDATLAIIFGQDAFRSAAIFAREGAAGLNEMRDATEKQGLTAQLAAARTKGFAGKVESLKNSASTAGLSLGQILIPALDILAQSLNADILLIGKFLEEARKLLTLDFSFPGKKKGGDIFGGVLGSFGDIGRGLDKLTADIPVVNSFFDPVTSQSEEAKRALDDLQASLEAVAGDSVHLASQIQEAFKSGTFTLSGGETGRGGPNAAVQFVEDLKKKITDTTPHAEELRALLDGIVRAILALGRAPTDIELKALFDTGSIPDELAKVQGRVSSAPPIIAPLGFKADPNDVKSVAKDSVVFLRHAAEEEAQRSAANASGIFKDFFGGELDTGAAAAIFDPFMLTAVPSAEKAGAEAGKHFSSSFQDQLDLLEAQGAGPRAALALAEAQLPGALRRLRRAQARFEANPTEEHKKFRDFAVQRVKEIRAEIASATGDIQSAAKTEADKITKARNAADQKILDAFSAQTSAASNAVLRAQRTPGLADDIKRQTFLRDLIKRQIGEAQNLKDQKLRTQTIASLTTDLINANKTLDDLNQQLQDSLQQRFEIRVDIAKATGNVTVLRKIFAERLRQLRAALADAQKGSLVALQLRQKIAQTQQDAFDAINESFELDVSFAETTGNKAKEIKARNALIAQLKREQAQVKKGTLEWKRLRNEIAEQTKAVQEVDQANKKFFQQASFAFLTTQQGFAANLLGNLLPMGAIGNTVANKLATGGSTAPSGSDKTSVPNFTPTGSNVGILPQEHGRGRVPPSARTSVNNALGTAPAAAGPAGPTRGQQSVELDLLRKILRAIEALHAATKHPEAKTRSRQNNAAMDVHEHGIGGGG